MENSNYQKLINTLKYIFQIDRGDLDFGIYRILNQKHEEITHFLEHDLVPQVKQELDTYESGDKEQLEAELDKLTSQLRDLGVSDEDQAKNTKVAEIQAKLNTAGRTEELENEVFSHLVRFFERYYEEGDFISKRRYKDGVYAIPYEGEEVKLYWANHDQYYIKTSEQFKDFTFRVDDKRVHFRISEAETDSNNNKNTSGKDRRFVVLEEDCWSEDNGELSIYFQYKSLDEKKTQDACNSESIQAILKALPEQWRSVLGALTPTEKQKDRTVLGKYLTSYTARNTFDYFIHKDLGTFLNRELDFYIKNEVMYLDDMENESAPRADQYLAKVKVVRSIAKKIIRMLAQLEDFQKKLWEKKKFVVGTGYCITLDLVPEQYYEAVLNNQEQIAEWQQLGFIDDKTALDHEYLKSHPTLSIDTKFFPELKDELLASFDNIDQQVNGVMINSENFGALNLLQERYLECLTGVHIDPPYNTDTSGFLYKNSFKRSSWLTMMDNRLRSSSDLLCPTGSIQCHIDENEYEHLTYLLDTFSLINSGTVVWDKKNPMMGTKGIATRHEYIIWRSKNEDTFYLPSKSINLMLEKVANLVKFYGSVTDKVRKEYVTWLEANKDLTGGEKAYKHIDDEGRIYRGVALGAPEYRYDKKFHVPLVHPVTNKPCPVPSNGFSRTPETLQELVKNGEILFGKDENSQPNKKLYLTEDTKRQFPSVLELGTKGKADINPLGLNFPYNHPVELYSIFINAISFNKCGLIADYFAGSGTTGHAILRLNREDNEKDVGSGQRKYILVEMGEYFNSVTKPRMQKVVYSDDWRDGKPQDDGVTGTREHIIKYFKLESYEDTLNNLELVRTKEQQATLDQHNRFREDYTLGYMLDVEASGSVLSTASFKNPFEYCIQMGTDVVGETKNTPVDLVETFNYLIGLKVETWQRHGEHLLVLEGETRAGEKTLIIWRNQEVVDSDGLDDFFKKQALSTTDFEYHKIYVNGDNNLENLKVEGDTWKVGLIEEEFHNRMFS